MHKLLSSFKAGIRYVKDNPQILFTLLLVVFVPTAFFFSAGQFQQITIQNQERLELDRIGIMHDVFASMVRVNGTKELETIQEQIERIAALNPDIEVFRLSKRVEEQFIPIAAYDTSVLGEPDEEALYRLAYSYIGESLSTSIYQGDVRYIQSVRLLQLNGEDFFIVTVTSREGVDALFAEREFRAYIILIVVIIAVLLLMLRHVRMIDYSYLYRQVSEANHTKDLFTNMIAHELRAPLTAMRGYASLIHEDEALPEQTREHAKKIDISATNLVAIVSDLLDVARIQSGKLSVETTHVDLSLVIANTIDTLRTSADKKHIKLLTEGTEGEHTVSGDPKRLQQVLTNLVSNSIKYTQSGSITVSVETKRDRIELRVKDTGMGISAEDQKKLFAPFFRVNSKEVGNITGTGLGMWITKQLVDLMGASIGVESIKGVGTHIVLTLPKQ